VFERVFEESGLPKTIRNENGAPSATPAIRHDGVSFDRIIRMRRGRDRDRATLNDDFRAGTPAKAPLDGSYAGVLIALDIAPGLTSIFRYVAERWMPWQGKTFDSRRASGDNVFTRDSLGLAHIFWPLYRGYRDDGPQNYRAFEFRTRVAPGLFDPDRQVLQIEYDLPSNPSSTIRRVLDELVQVAAGEFLGKAHFQWWWGRWQTVAFFALSEGGN